MEELDAEVQSLLDEELSKNESVTPSEEFAPQVPRAVYPGERFPTRLPRLGSGQPFLGAVPPRQGVPPKIPRLQPQFSEPQFVPMPISPRSARRSRRSRATSTRGYNLSPEIQAIVDRAVQSLTPEKREQLKQISRRAGQKGGAVIKQRIENLKRQQIAPEVQQNLQDIIAQYSNVQGGQVRPSTPRVQLGGSSPAEIEELETSIRDIENRLADLRQSPSQFELPPAPEPLPPLIPTEPLPLPPPPLLPRGQYEFPATFDFPPLPPQYQEGFI